MNATTASATYRLVWSLTTKFDHTVRPDGAVLLEDWTTAHQVWVVAVVAYDADGDEINQLAVDGLNAGDDEEDAAPWRAAEDRALTEAGLTRDAIAEIILP